MDQASINGVSGVANGASDGSELAGDGSPLQSAEHPYSFPTFEQEQARAMSGGPFGASTIQ